MAELVQRSEAGIDPRFAAAETLFFVIGAQKAGTTWLHAYCKSHDEISVPAWKETNYWSVLDNTGTVGLHLKHEKEKRQKLLYPVRRVLRELKLVKPSVTVTDRTVDRLLNALEHPGPPHRDYADALFLQSTAATRASGEVCPQYSALKEETLRAMVDLNADTRFVFCMRDPVSRVISAAQHKLRGWTTNAGYVETDVAEKFIVEEINNPRSWMIGMTDYSRTISRLECCIPKENIKYVFFEQLFEQPTIDGFCDFIGVNRKPGKFDKKVNEGGDLASRLPERVYVALANRLAHVYRDISGKFGDALPKKWAESAALITNDRFAHV